MKRSFEERGSSLPPKRTKAEHGSCSSESDSSGAREEQRMERHYILRPDERFDDDRYRVVKQLGKGTFGRVVEMWDEQDQRSVAVKVVRAVEKYYREAEVEAEILLKVQSDSAADGLSTQSSEPKSGAGAQSSTRAPAECERKFFVVVAPRGMVAQHGRDGRARAWLGPRGGAQMWLARRPFREHRQPPFLPPKIAQKPPHQSHQPRTHRTRCVIGACEVASHRGLARLADAAPPLALPPGYSPCPRSQCR